MPPEASVLKRERKKPAEWWTAAPTSSPSVSQGTARSPGQSKETPTFRGKGRSSNLSRDDNSQRKRTDPKKNVSGNPTGIAKVAAPGKRKSINQEDVQGISAQDSSEESRLKKRKISSKPKRKTASTDQDATQQARRPDSSQEERTTKKARSSTRDADLTPINYKEIANRKQRHIERESSTSQLTPDASISENKSKGLSTQATRRRRSSISEASAHLVQHKITPQGEDSNLTAANRRSSQNSTQSTAGTKRQGKRLSLAGGQETHPTSAYGQTNKMASRLSKGQSSSSSQQEPTKSAKKVSQNNPTSPRPQSQATKASKAVAATSNKPQTHERFSHRPSAKFLEAEPSEGMEYQHLTAVTRRISRTTIENKWDGLPAPCVNRISEFLQDAQKPILARIRDEWQQGQASTAIQWISRKLVGKISRGLPFPPSIRSNQEDDFDFENILDHNRVLESQLTPVLHANKLLEAELAKETALLDTEVGYLDELEANAKKEASKLKQDTRKLHTLLQSSVQEDHEGVENFIASVPGESGTAREPTRFFEVRDDLDLLGVVQDLQGHVGSIEGNLNQVDGIPGSMVKCRAAVQAALIDRLTRTQYEAVILN